MKILFMICFSAFCAGTAFAQAANDLTVCRLIKCVKIEDDGTELLAFTKGRTGPKKCLFSRLPESTTVRSICASGK
jgi:hypothetical protein